MEMQRKKIVILGYGQRGKIYADYALRCFEEFTVVAIIENNPERRKVAASRHDCPVFSDYKDFLKAEIQADIVAVATLADTACILLAEGVELDKEILDTASAKGVNILSSKLSAYELANKISSLNI